jgi:hypothetical protein
MDLASIIALVSQHNVDPTTAPECSVDPEVTETVIGRNLPKPVRGKIPATTAHTGEQAAPIHHSTAPKTVERKIDKLDAKGFMGAMRKAKSRDESIVAICGYTGLTWNEVSSDFGNQDREARAAAMREIRAAQGIKVVVGPTREEKRNAERSMLGFVHGMPVPQQRLVLDLRARAQSAAEARDKATTDQERALHQQVLDAANKALAELGF